MRLVLATLLALPLLAAPPPGRSPALPAGHWVQGALADLPFPAAVGVAAPFPTRVDAARHLARWLEDGEPTPDLLPPLLVDELGPDLRALGHSLDRAAARAAARSGDRGAALREDLAAAPRRVPAEPPRPPAPREDPPEPPRPPTSRPAPPGHVASAAPRPGAPGAAWHYSLRATRVLEQVRRTRSALGALEARRRAMDPAPLGAAAEPAGTSKVGGERASGTTRRLEEERSAGDGQESPRAR